MENKTMKSTIVKDAIALFLITLVAGLALGYVYELTREPIARRLMEEKLATYQVVFTKADRIEEDEELMLQAEETNLGDFDAAFGRTKIEEVNRVYGSNGELIGYILVLTTRDGFSPPITFMLGYDNQGITGMEFLIINETPGYGAVAAESEFKDQFVGKQVNEFTIVNSGATGDQINAIGGATVTTKAVVNAVNAGIRFLSEYSQIGGGMND